MGSMTEQEKFRASHVCNLCRVLRFDGKKDFTITRLEQTKKAMKKAFTTSVFT